MFFIDVLAISSLLFDSHAHPHTDTDIGAEDPLDLTTLKYMLDTQAIPSMRHFYKYVVNIFQYAYDFNKPHQVCVVVCIAYALCAACAASV